MRVSQKIRKRKRHKKYKKGSGSTSYRKGEADMGNEERKAVKEIAGRNTHTRPDRREWYKLDLSAIVYPTLQRRDFSSVYRLSVVLKEKINPTRRQCERDCSGGI